MKDWTRVRVYVLVCAIPVCRCVRAYVRVEGAQDVRSRAILLL